MNYKMIIRILGRILLVEAAFMVPALGVSGFNRETGAVGGFAAAILIIAAVGYCACLVRPDSKRFYAREGFVTVGLGWIFVSLFGMLPFIISGAIPDVVDAFFETVSGLTTTGATILGDIEALPRGLLYWRSFTHWLGGMGVLVFLLAIGSMSREAGYSMHLLRAESTGPNPGKLVPRMHRSAKILYGIYIALTVIEVAALLLTGVEFFDSVTITFGTVGTGGFAIKNDSIASYPVSAQIVITVFMILSGINFNLYYLLLLREFKKVFKDAELRTYIIILAAATALLMISNLSMFATAGENLLHAAFQSASIMSSTGFATVDFALWPEFSETILVMLMIIGACTGSTGGGIKVLRTMILLKSVKRTINDALRPNQVQVMHVGDVALEPETVRRVEAFLVIYFILMICSAVLISLDGLSFESSFTAVMACLNNVGPGFGQVGPYDSFSVFSWVGKLTLCLNMLLGRLELFPVIILFTPSVWKK